MCVKQEPCPAPCPGHTGLEVILEVSDGGTQLYRPKRKTEKEGDLNQQLDSKGPCISKNVNLNADAYVEDIVLLCFIHS